MKTPTCRTDRWGFDCKQIAGSVGSGIQSRIAARIVLPEHVVAQLLADDLHRMLGQLGTLGVEEGAAILVFGNPSAGEGAVLDVGEDLTHPGLGLLVGDDAGAGDILAKLSRVGD